MAKRLIRLLVSLYAFVYRLTGGRLGHDLRGFDVLLLTTTGRKSGKKRTTPLGYFEYEGAYVITASYVALGGAYPGWFYNLQHNPRISIQVKDKQQEVIAEVAAPEKRSLLWAQLMEVAPDYGQYQNRTTREIPMVMLRPVHMASVPV